MHTADSCISIVEGLLHRGNEGQGLTSGDGIKAESSLDLPGTKPTIQVLLHHSAAANPNL